MLKKVRFLERNSYENLNYLEVYFSHKVKKLQYNILIKKKHNKKFDKNNENR